MNDYEIIKNLYIDLCQASINKDIDRLNEILSNNYILEHMTGMKQTKDDYIKSVLSGELEYYKSEHENIEINIDGDYATIIGKTKTFASPFGMSKSWWRLKQDMTVEKINNKWIITHSIASTY